MTSCKRWTSIVAAMVLAAVMLPASLAYARAAGAGSLHITPSQVGAGASYDAYRIADDAALPQDDQFDWPALSGAELDGREPYPSYDPSSPSALADGRELVERVSDDVLQDDAGVLAQALTAYVPDGVEPEARVVAGGSAVAVRDGWYLLVAQGRRPLLAWVDGEPVELGDKSDAPVVSKQVGDGEGWGDAVVSGPGRPIRCRVDVSVPTAVEAFRSYPITVVDKWDAHLLLAEESVRVELVPAGDPDAAQDVTGQMVIEVGETSLSVEAPDLLALGAKPGDALRVTYVISIAPDAQVGAAGLANTAYAVFPTWMGEQDTPADVVRVHSLRVVVTKVNEAGEPLAGAVFAVKGKEGWLAADGSFGAESGRAEFTSNAQGVLEGMPLLANGAYELVELSAPKGYRPLEQGAPFELDARPGDGGLKLEARATGPLSVSGVDAQEATASFELVNKKVASGWLDQLMPQTGDGAWWVIASALLVAGAVALFEGERRRRAER